MVIEREVEKNQMTQLAAGKMSRMGLMHFDI